MILIGVNKLSFVRLVSGDAPAAKRYLGWLHHKDTQEFLGALRLEAGIAGLAVGSASAEHTVGHLAGQASLFDTLDAAATVAKRILDGGTAAVVEPEADYGQDAILESWKPKATKGDKK